ncbi:MAG: TolC family protein [Alphaproteobacteria bacterium]
MFLGRCTLTSFLTVTAMGVAVLGAKSASAITLEEVLAQLAGDHPTIRTEVERVNSADQRLRGTKAFFLPTVSLSSDYGYERIDSPTRRVSRGKPAKELRESVTLNLTQNVFDGFRKNFDRRGASEDKAAAADILENTEQIILFQGASAYIDVLRQSELIQLVQENEARIQRQFELETTRAASGQGLASDVLLARQRLQQARERRVIFNGSLQDSFSRYRQLFGEMPDVADMVTPLAPIDLLPRSLDDALKQARRGHPLIVSTNNQVDAARARQLAAQSDLFPRLDIVGRANFERDVNDTPGVRRDMSVFLQATWDLFTGFSIQSNVAATAFDHAAILNNLQSINLQIEEEVRLSWQALQTTCERRFLLENALSIALEVLDLRRTLQAAGQETAFRVLDAETEVTDSQINLAAAVFDEMTTVYRTVLAVGRLDVDTLSEAAVFSRTPEATPSMIDWCREYANLDLRDDIVASTNAGPTSDDPFAFRGDDLGAGSTDENPFAQPPSGATDDNPFAAPDDDPFEGEEGDDPFASIIDDDAEPEPDEGAGLSPLFDDDTDITEDGDLFLDDSAEDDDISTDEPVFADDQERSISADQAPEPRQDRTIGAQEFFDFDLDDDINRTRDLDR